MIQILALIGLFGCGLVLWSTVDLWVDPEGEF